MQDKAKCLVGRRQHENHSWTIFFTWVTKQWNGTYKTTSLWENAPSWKAGIGRAGGKSPAQIPRTARSPWWESQPWIVNTFLACTDFLSTSPGLWRTRWSETKHLQDIFFTGRHCGKQGLKKHIICGKKMGSLHAPRIQEACENSQRSTRVSFLILSIPSGPQDKRNSKKERK